MPDRSWTGRLMTTQAIAVPLYKCGHLSKPLVRVSRLHSPTGPGIAAFTNAQAARKAVPPTSTPSGRKLHADAADPSFQTTPRNQGPIMKNQIATRLPSLSIHGARK